MKAHFINRDNIDLSPLPPDHWWQKTQYVYHAHPLSPLTYIDAIEQMWQPDRRYQTDLGSIPRWLQWAPGLNKDTFLGSYLMHDSCYHHGGLWTKAALAHNYCFAKLTRKQADRMLRHMCKAEGAPSWLAAMIYRGVRMGPLVGVKYNQASEG